MARYGERLPYATYTGQLPAFNLWEEDWRSLEMAIGRPIHLGARDTLSDQCRDYIEDELLERSAVKVADLQVAAKRLIDVCQPFVSLAYGSRPEGLNSLNDGGWSEFISIFEEKLSEQRLNVSEWGEDPFEVSLSPQLLTEVAIRVSSTLQQIYERPVPQTFRDHDGLRVGASLEAFIIKIKAWARDNDLPYGLMSADERAPAVCRFLFELGRLLPQEVRPDVESALAYVGRMKRAQTRTKNRHK